MNHLRLLAVVLFIVLSTISTKTTAQQYDAGEYAISFCDQCDSSTMYQNYALTLEPGKHVIFNMVRTEAKALQVVYGFDKSGSGQRVKYAFNVSLPTSAAQAQEKLVELDQAFQSVIAGMLTFTSTNFLGQPTEGITGDGCHAETFSEFWLINSINFPFYEACDVHARCYADGELTKKACDEWFFIEMMNDLESFEVQSYLSLQGLVAGYIMEEFLEYKAKALYGIISSDDSAYASFCEGKDDSWLECMSGTRNWYHVGDLANGWVWANGIRYIQICETWRFPNGEGGYYFMDRNCRLLPDPSFGG